MSIPYHNHQRHGGLHFSEPHSSSSSASSLMSRRNNKSNAFSLLAIFTTSSTKKVSKALMVMFFLSNSFVELLAFNLGLMAKVGSDKQQQLGAVTSMCRPCPAAASTAPVAPQHPRASQPQQRQQLLLLQQESRILTNTSGGATKSASAMAATKTFELTKTTKESPSLSVSRNSRDTNNTTTNNNNNNHQIVPITEQNNSTRLPSESHTLPTPPPVVDASMSGHSFISGSESDDDPLPGAFATNTLYLQGIRLTTSYDQTIHDLHVDLFGFPGDLTRLSDRVREWTVCQNVTHNFNQTLWGREEIIENVTMFCQLPGQPDLIPMLFMPMSSFDSKQDTCSAFLWRCNVTETLSRPQLLEHMKRNPTADAMSVHIWTQYKHGHTNQQSQVTKVATFRISLETGAKGVGSTTNMRGDGAVNKSLSYFHQPPIPIGLCVAIYGDRPLAYLQQFVQHHLNAGFPSVVFGIRGPPNGVHLNAARRILAHYIDQGEVSLTHYDGPFITEGDTAKLQFYLSCLYHYKGLAKYVATWDIDEFWLPPDTLNVNGRHSSPYYKVAGGVFVQPAADAAKTGSMINASHWSTFPSAVQNDPLWQKSPYATSVSISDTVNAIDRYYAEKGCDFCFHSFPSHTVFRRPGHQSDRNRTKRISRDFEQQCSIPDTTWQKSIVNTKVAHSVGFHIGGSCFSGGVVNASLPRAVLEQQFRTDSISANCSARRFEGSVYGTIHHFFELLGGRYVYCANFSLNRKDEYVSLFASTVERQVDRDLTSAASGIFGMSPSR